FEDINTPISELVDDEFPEDGKYTASFTTYGENGGNHEIVIDKNDTIKDVLKQINDKDNNVRAFYDEQSGKIIMETTRTGKYNTEGDDGPEINFDNDSFFTSFLEMSNEVEAQDAVFSYNGLELTSKNNSYTLNDITFNFNSTTDGKSATLTVNNDTDAAFDSIMAFVDKYNEVVEVMNGSQREEKHRDFPPLTEAQKEEMTEKENELWEEKAKS